MIALANRHPEEVVKKLASVYDSLIYQNLII
jgi:hypothetical protein